MIDTIILGETEMRSNSMRQDIKNWDNFFNKLYYDQTHEETTGGSTVSKNNSSYLINFTLQL